MGQEACKVSKVFRESKGLPALLVRQQVSLVSLATLVMLGRLALLVLKAFKANKVYRGYPARQLVSPALLVLMAL